MVKLRGQFRFVPALLLGVGFVAAYSTGALAKTFHYSKTVKSGKQTKLDHFMGWKNDCTFLTIKIDIVERPKFGKASPRIVDARIRKAQVGSTGKCKGRKVKGLGIFYRSKRGYRGGDKLKIRMKVPGQRPVNYVYKIKVR